MSLSLNHKWKSLENIWTQGRFFDYTFDGRKTPILIGGKWEPSNVFKKSTGVNSIFKDWNGFKKMTRAVFDTTPIPNYHYRI